MTRRWTEAEADAIARRFPNLDAAVEFGREMAELEAKTVRAQQRQYMARGEMAALPEATILPAVLDALRRHPSVAWAVRMNVGTASFAERRVRFGVPGMADITGQLKTGARLEVEVKTGHGEVSAEQAAFLRRVNAAGGLAFVARSIGDVIKNLGPYSARR